MNKKLSLLLMLVVVFSCTTKETEFTDKAITLVKSKLRNPRTSKVIKTEVFDIEKDTIKVHLNMDVKNGFGLFTEQDYYVFFIKKGNSYEERFSEIDYLEMTSEERMKRHLENRKNN